MEATTKPSPPAVTNYVTETSPTDVLLGRGVDLNRYQGNIDFRHLIQSRINDYIDAKHKGHNKGSITQDIYNTIVNRNGRFLRKVKTRDEREKLKIPNTETSTSIWVPVTKDVAIAKIAQAFRDSDKKVDPSMNTKNTKSVETVPSATFPPTTTTSRSKITQKCKSSYNKEKLKKAQLKSGPAEDSLKSLIARTLLQYQQQQQERQQNRYASVPSTLNETSSTVPLVPVEAISIKTHPTTKTPVNSFPRQPIESLLYQHQSSENSSQLLNVPHVSHMNNYTEAAMRRHSFVENLSPSVSEQMQSHFTSTNSVRQDPFASDLTLLLQQQQLLSTLPSRSSYDNQISPFTILQQQISTLPLPTDGNMIPERYSVYDRYTSNNHNMTIQVQRYLMSDRRDPLELEPNFRLQRLGRHMQNLHHDSAIMMTPSINVTEAGNNPLLSQLVSQHMHIPTGRAAARLPNDAPYAADDDSNNDQGRLNRRL